MRLLRSLSWIVFLAFLASCASRGSRYYYFGDYSDAERYYNKGEYQKAIDKYQAYLDGNPEGNLAVISQYYIGKSYVALGKTDKAKKVFQEITQKYPELVWTNFAQNQLKELELQSAGKSQTQK
ncbi:MAG: tetratricopeptide repeat protein [Candidatus Omnitrophica bacterium]|nr:tetratricopeptide repeat protein [Candidatus Omnitrophota bacterium]